MGPRSTARPVPVPVTLSFASILARDFLGLSAYYEGVFDLDEVADLTSPHFRGLWLGSTVLGFSARSAYQLLDLPEPADEEPAVRTFLTFEVGESDVETYADRGVEAGGTLVQAPHDTYYGAWQAVLLDPEGNAFRVNHLPLAVAG